MMTAMTQVPVPTTSKEECLRSQIVTLNEAQGKHLKYMPYALLEDTFARN